MPCQGLFWNLMNNLCYYLFIIISSTQWLIYADAIIIIVILMLTEYLFISAEPLCKHHSKGTVSELCQSSTRKLSGLFLTRGKVTQSSTKHPVQTKHSWQTINMYIYYHEHISCRNLEKTLNFSNKQQLPILHLHIIKLMRSQLKWVKSDLGCVYLPWFLGAGGLSTQPGR